MILTLAICNSVTAQIELTYSKVKTISGVTNPQVIGGILFVGEDSVPTPSQGAVVKCKTKMKFSEFELYRGDEEIDMRMIDQLIDQTVKETTTTWLVTGEGSYKVVARGYDPELGMEKVKLAFVLGKPAPPIPPEPLPDPPKPDPPKPDITPVKNAYNVGAIAYKTAPSDIAIAQKIAGWYRVGASKLYGIGGLSDIERIKADIDRQFAQKQCQDQATCQQWDRWKAAVSQAVVAEQIRRKSFLREDWFAAMVEIAEALEAVK